VAGALILAGTACDSAAPVTEAPATTNRAGSPPVVEWDARDYSYTAPETLPSGWVTIRMMNHGPEPHHGQLLRLNDGVTFEQFAAALQREGEAAVRLTTLVGGPAIVDPHRTDQVTLNLQPGTYALACFVPSPDGALHLTKGMLKRLEVSAAERSTAAPPPARGTFIMRDFSFEMPDTMPAGPATYEVVNAGPQPHELVVVKLAEGKTVADVQEWFRAAAPPPPFEAVGGINSLGNGQSGYMTLDLGPGRYAAICVVPEQASGVPHLHLGMVKAFTVLS
jgi:hypothetical protein